MWKKIFVIIAALVMILCVALLGTNVEGGSSDMYVSIYALDGNHVMNVNIEKWDITKRVFDFDTAKFEGVASETVPSSGLFIFRNNIGEWQYSGLLKEVEQDGDYVKFKSEDLRKYYDSDIIIDYTQVAYSNIEEDALTTQQVFSDVMSWLIESNGYPLDLKVPFAQYNEGGTGLLNHTAFISNPMGTYKIKNAWQYLKPYLAYYDFYTQADFAVQGDLGRSSKSYKIGVVASEDNGLEIKLDDFRFSQTKSEVKFNHAIATLKQDVNSSPSHVFTYSSPNYYYAAPASLQNWWHVENFTQAEADAFIPAVYFDDSSEDFDYDTVFRIDIWEGTKFSSTVLRTTFAQIVDWWDTREDLATMEYWLGTDNVIYYNSVQATKKSYPVKTRVFEADNLSEAQFQAVYALATSRYIENIILTESPDNPFELKDLTLYEKIDVYDQDGTMRTLPVSEIHWTNSKYEVKLGFKQTLLTQVIKGGN